MKELHQTNNTFSFHIPSNAERMCDLEKQLCFRKQKVHVNDRQKLSSPQGPQQWRSRSIDGASRPRAGSEWQKLRRVNSNPNSATPSRPKWHYVMFGPANVPPTMDVKDMHNRQFRNHLMMNGGVDEGKKFCKRPWKLLQSLSCKAVEISAVAEVPYVVNFRSISC